MKRSKQIAFLALGGVAIVALVSCGEDSQALPVYKTVDECAAATGDRALCESEMAAARLGHEDSAPRFKDEAACRQEFDNCVGVTGVDGTASWFMPALGGFVLGRMLSQGGVAQPVFYDRKGYAFVRNLPPNMRQEDKTYYGTSGGFTTYYGGGSSSQKVAGGSGGYSRVGAASGGSSITVSRGGFGSSGSHASS